MIRQKQTNKKKQSKKKKSIWKILQILKPPGSHGRHYIHRFTTEQPGRSVVHRVTDACSFQWLGRPTRLEFFLRQRRQPLSSTSCLSSCGLGPSERSCWPCPSPARAPARPGSDSASWPGEPCGWRPWTSAHRNGSKESDVSWLEEKWRRPFRYLS